MLSDEVKVITVNGLPQSVHSSVLFLDYARAVRLSGLRWRKDYHVSVAYPNDTGVAFYLESGTMISVEDGMVVSVVPRVWAKRWWQVWK